MPFAPGGTYSLPSAAFVTHTGIKAPLVNADFNDIATALSTVYPTALVASSLTGVGNVQLTRSAASTLKLSPYNGTGLTINSTVRNVPTTGVTVTLTGLTAGTIYYVYAYWTGSAAALEYTTIVPTTDTTSGMMVKTGAASRTLVGGFAATSTTDTSDTLGSRQVASWFNPICRIVQGSTLSGVTGAGTIANLGTSANAIKFFRFATRPGRLFFTGYVLSAQTGFNTYTTLGNNNDDLNVTTFTTGRAVPFSVECPFWSVIDIDQSNTIFPRGGTDSGTATWNGTVRGWLY